MLVGVTRRVHGAITCGDACRGGVAPTAVLARAGLAPRLVTLLRLHERDNGRYRRSLPVLAEVGEGVVWVGVPLRGIAAHVRDVVDVLGLGDHGDVDGSLVRWAVEAEAPAIAAVVVDLSFVTRLTR